jgi:hypothetical protein
MSQAVQPSTSGNEGQPRERRRDSPGGCNLILKRGTVRMSYPCQAMITATFPDPTRKPVLDADRVGAARDLHAPALVAAGVAQAAATLAYAHAARATQQGLSAESYRTGAHQATAAANQAYTAARAAAVYGEVDVAYQAAVAAYDATAAATAAARTARRRRSSAHKYVARCSSSRLTTMSACSNSSI